MEQGINSASLNPDSAARWSNQVVFFHGEISSCHPKKRFKPLNIGIFHQDLRLVSIKPCMGIEWSEIRIEPSAWWLKQKPFGCSTSGGAASSKCGLNQRRMVNCFEAISWSSHAQAVVSFHNKMTLEAINILPCESYGMTEWQAPRPRSQRNRMGQQFSGGNSCPPPKSDLRYPKSKWRQYDLPQSAQYTIGLNSWVDLLSEAAKLNS